MLAPIQRRHDKLGTRAQEGMQVGHCIGEPYRVLLSKRKVVMESNDFGAHESSASTDKLQMENMIEFDVSDTNVILTMPLKGLSIVI